MCFQTVPKTQTVESRRMLNRSGSPTVKHTQPETLIRVDGLLMLMVHYAEHPDWLGRDLQSRDRAFLMDILALVYMSILALRYWY